MRSTTTPLQPPPSPPAPSSSTASLLSSTTISLLRRRGLSSITSSPHSLLRSEPPRHRRRLLRRLSTAFTATSTATATATDSVNISWSTPLPSSTDGCNGWAYVDHPPHSLPTKKRSVPTIVIGGIAAALLAVSCFLLSRKGCKLHFRSITAPLRGNVSVIKPKTDDEEINGGLGVRNEKVFVVPGGVAETVDSDKDVRVKLSVPLDSTQLEALLVLKNLKIIEDDVRADELCTRREYARWLVRLNSLLERNPKHRIVPSSALSGSVIAAFDDVSVEDPDFEYIQALAEAGVVHSKVSARYSNSGSSKENGSCFFYPDRFISRQDLINWKAQLEYGEYLGRITEQMSRIKVDYMDVKEINSDASPELFVDMMAGDKSIIRKVFGQIRRLQPNKPLTKAQAVVALTSGRMTEAVRNEILRLKAENASRRATMKEIMSELLEKGDIKRYWDKKVDEERNNRLEMEKLYSAILHDLESEKIIVVKTSTEQLKEKATMDCQRQLLLGLKEEIDEMSERLSSKKAVYIVEKQKVQQLLGELEPKQEGILNTKSILEAEIEAVRILRTWIEDEARKTQARANVLEEVGRRWKWGEEA